MNAVFAIWHGGTYYSEPCIPEDVERFASLVEAAQVLRSRATEPWAQQFSYINKPTDTAICLRTDDCEMRVYLSDPSSAIDPHPDYLIRWTGGDVSIERVR